MRRRLARVRTAAAPPAIAPRRRAIHAMSEYNIRKMTYKIDHSRDCRSMSDEARSKTGSSAARAGKPDWKARRDDRRRGKPSPAYQACNNGLVALSRTKGRPIEAVSNQRTERTGSDVGCKRSQACGAMGRNERLTISSAMCKRLCWRGRQDAALPRRRTDSQGVARTERTPSKLPTPRPSHRKSAESAWRKAARQEKAERRRGRLRQGTR